MKFFEALRVAGQDLWRARLALAPSGSLAIPLFASVFFGFKVAIASLLLTLALAAFACLGLLICKRIDFHSLRRTTSIAVRNQNVAPNAVGADTATGLGKRDSTLTGSACSNPPHKTVTSGGLERVLSNIDTADADGPDLVSSDTANSHSSRMGEDRECLPCSDRDLKFHNEAAAQRKPKTATHSPVPAAGNHGAREVRNDADIVKPLDAIWLIIVSVVIGACYVARWLQ